MAVQIESDAEADADLTNGIFPPVSDGLIGFFEHQGTIDRARLNLVDGEGATVVGTPVVAADGVTFTGSTNYLVTDIAEQDTMTILQVSRIESTLVEATSGAAPFWGFFNGTGGHALWAAARTDLTPAPPAGRLRGSVFRGDGPVSTVADLLDPDMSGWRLRASRLGPAASVKVDDLTSELSAVATNASARVLGTATLAIGSLRTTGYAGSVKALRTAVYSRVLTDTEMATMYAWLAEQVAEVDEDIVI